MITKSALLAFVALLGFPFVAQADLQATQRLEAAWRNAADLDGEIVSLSGANKTFAAIHRAPTDEPPVGAIVLLHDSGTSANSHEVVRPLRIGLSEAGWHTLSVQLPAAYPGARPSAWLGNAAQIGAAMQAALGWLKQQNQLNQVVLALGDSGLIALRNAAATSPKELQAMVLVSAPTDFAGEADGDMLGKLKLRILDIYAERDRPAVTTTAKARKRVAVKAEIARYDQRLVLGATAGFRAQEAQLLATIRAWLKAYAAGKEIIGRE